MTEYRATWSTELRVFSVLFTLLFVCFIFVFWDSLVAGNFRSPSFWIGLLPLVYLIGSALFTVRGYSISSGFILVHRLFWKTRLSRQGLESAEYHPGVLRKSIKPHGVGCLFSFSGWWCGPLGWFRVFATDTNRTVVLRLRGKTIVLTPDEPERFISELMGNGGSGKVQLALEAYAKGDRGKDSSEVFDQFRNRKK